MQRRRSGFLLILLGFLLAGGAGFGVYRIAEQASKSRPPMASVVVATKDIPERSLVSTTALGVKMMLLSSIPPGALQQPQEASGKMSTTKIYAGEVLLDGQLAKTDGQDGLAYTLKPGQVLITMPASDIVGTGAVRVGDSVDLLLTLLPPQQGATNGPTTPADALPETSQTAMQNLRVVSIGSTAGPVSSTTSKTTTASPPLAIGSLITFAVSHEDALRLKAMKDSSRLKIEMVLRAAGDKQIAQTTPVTIDSLVNDYHLNTAPGK